MNCYLNSWIALFKSDLVDSQNWGQQDSLGLDNIGSITAFPYIEIFAITDILHILVKKLIFHEILPPPLLKTVFSYSISSILRFNVRGGAQHSN